MFESILSVLAVTTASHLAIPDPDWTYKNRFPGTVYSIVVPIDESTTECFFTVGEGKLVTKAFSTYINGSCLTAGCTVSREASGSILTLDAQCTNKLQITVGKPEWPAETGVAVVLRPGDRVDLANFENAIRGSYDESTFGLADSCGDFFDSFIRAKASLLDNRQNDAIAELGCAGALMGADPYRALIHLLVWDAQLSTGDTAGAALTLQDAVNAASPDQRLSSIVGYVTGTVSLDEVLANAGNDTVALTEAYYYIGLAEKSQGRNISAMDWFRAASDLGAKRQIEWDLAQSELAGMTNAD